MDGPVFKLSNFLAAPSNLRKREIIERTIHFNPNDSKQKGRARQLLKRADKLGLAVTIGRNSLTFSGYIGDVKRVLNPAHLSSTRRSGSRGARMTRRQRH